VAEHSLNQGHHIYFEDTAALAKLLLYTSRVIQKAIEISFFYGSKSAA
jgi:hypothetical protein